MYVALVATVLRHYLYSRLIVVDNLKQYDKTDMRKTVLDPLQASVHNSW